MNQLDIRLLQSIRGYPAVSILVPTHRTAPDNQQDPIRVKNLVDQAKERLLAEFSARELAPVVERLNLIVEEIDYTFTLDGLAIFVNADFARKFYIPFSVKPRVVIDETFATRDLVYALNRTKRYWVVALSEQPTRLYEGTRETLVEVTEHGFPMTMGRSGGERGAQAGRLNEGAYRDELHRQFFRDIVNGVAEVRKEDELPVALVGVQRYLSFFTELMPDKEAIVARVEGNHDKSTAHQIGQLVWPEVKKGLDARRQQALDELGAAVGARRFVSTISDIWQYAHDGRGELLVVEEGFYFPARMEDNGRRIVAADDATAPDVIDDAVDEIIEAVLLKGGRVAFVDDGDLKDHQRIALVTRY